MRSFCLILLLLIPGLCWSQAVKQKYQFAEPGITQIRESYNYGFVFTGPQLKYGRAWRWETADHRIDIESSLGFAGVFKKGAGIDFHLTPVNIFYLVKLNDLLWIGPDILTDYNYEFFPDLQMGHDFWFSHYSAGALFLFQKAFAKRLFFVKISGSAFGFTSRTPSDYNTLFFDIGFRSALKDLHSNMSWSSINKYNVSHLEIGLKPLAKSRVSFSFLTGYSAFYSHPRWTRLDYGIKVTILPKP